MALLRFIAAALSTAAAIRAKVIPIRALENNRFSPNATAAEVGDLLEFHFLPLNHSVVMGDVSDACQPINTSAGFYSGFLAVAEGQEAGLVFRVPINDTTPFVYYCSQGIRGRGHCQDGMVGLVNYPDAEGVLQRYADAASSVELAGTPDSGPFGGTFAPAPADAADCGCTTAATITTTTVTTATVTTGGSRSGSCTSSSTSTASYYPPAVVSTASYPPTVVSSSAAEATAGLLGGGGAAAAAGVVMAMFAV